MPPRRFSRHMFTAGIGDEHSNSLLTSRTPFRFVVRQDNRTHTVREGDTLFHVAGMYMRPLPRPAGLWWVIADFQPEPIHDPTLTLAPGTVLFIPSVRTVTEDIFNERRRLESQV